MIALASLMAALAMNPSARCSPAIARRQAGPVLVGGLAKEKGVVGKSELPDQRQVMLVECATLRFSILVAQLPLEIEEAVYSEIATIGPCRRHEDEDKSNSK